MDLLFQPILVCQRTPGVDVDLQSMNCINMVYQKVLLVLTILLLLYKKSLSKKLELKVKYARMTFEKEYSL